MDTKYEFGAYSIMSNKCNSCNKKDTCDNKNMELCGYLYPIEVNTNIRININSNTEYLQQDIFMQLKCYK